MFQIAKVYHMYLCLLLVVKCVLTCMYPVSALLMLLLPVVKMSL